MQLARAMHATLTITCHMCTLHYIHVTDIYFWIMWMNLYPNRKLQLAIYYSLLHAIAIYMQEAA